VRLPCGWVAFERLLALEDDLPRALYYTAPDGSTVHPIFWARVAPRPPGPGSLPMSLLQRDGTFRSPVLRGMAYAEAMLWLAAWLEPELDALDKI
jgi:hypothetical protein